CDARAGMVDRIAFLAVSARFCAIPVIATVESPEDWGGLHPSLAEPIGDAPVLRKEVFGLADDPLIGPAVAESGRRTTVLTGLQLVDDLLQLIAGLLERRLVAHSRTSVTVARRAPRLSRTPTSAPGAVAAASRSTEPEESWTMAYPRSSVAAGPSSRSRSWA